MDLSACYCHPSEAEAALRSTVVRAMPVIARERSAFITQCDMPVAVFGRYTDLLSADRGVRIIFDGVLYSKFYGNQILCHSHLQSILASPQPLVQ